MNHAGLLSQPPSCEGAAPGIIERSTGRGPRASLAGSVEGTTSKLDAPGDEEIGREIDQEIGREIDARTPLEARPDLCLPLRSTVRPADRQANRPGGRCDDEIGSGELDQVICSCRVHHNRHEPAAPTSAIDGIATTLRFHPHP